MSRVVIFQPKIFFEQFVSKKNQTLDLFREGKSYQEILELTTWSPRWKEILVDGIEFYFNVTEADAALKKRTWQQLGLVLVGFLFPLILIVIVWYMSLPL